MVLERKNHQKEKHMAKHLIVVSADALVFEDLEFAKDLPVLGKMMKEGA